MLFTHKFFKIQKMLTYEPLKFKKKKKRNMAAILAYVSLFNRKRINGWYQKIDILYFFDLFHTL